MTPIDWIIIAFAAGLALVGVRQGLIVGALTLAGFAGGAVLGARLAPALLEEGSRSPYAPITALAGAVVLGGVLAVLLESMGQGIRRAALRLPGARTLDAAGGAIVLAALGLGIAWVVGAVALNAPGADLRRDVQRSSILRGLNEVLPPSGPILNVLNRVELTPTVRGPEARVGRPDAAAASDPDVERAGGSVVRVVGSACGLGIAGSGWVAAPGIVVTNAHVVAGEEDTSVIDSAGGSHPASAVHYEPRDDLALLRVEGLTEAALPLVESPRSGSAGAVLGYPGQSTLRAAAARLGTTAQVTSRDSYGRGPVKRRMAAFRGRVERGNSGGPLVDRRGRVLTTVFASAVSESAPRGFGVPNSIVRKALRRAGDPVDTGPCAA